MSPWRLALIFTVLSVTLLACFPCLLRVAEWGWIPDAGWMPRPERLAAVVARHPRDPELRLGYALAAQEEARLIEYRAAASETPRAGSLDNASRRAEAAWQEAIRTPGSGPAPRVIRALYLLDKSLPDRPRQGYGNPKWRPVPLTPKQRQYAAEVLTLLREAVAQDPRNAWPRYLLAVAYLTQPQDEAAWQAVRAAAQAPGWEGYEVSSQKALCRLYRESGEPLALARRLGCSHALWRIASGPKRALARILAHRAEGLKTTGRHDEALAVYQSLLQYCQRLRRGARSLSDSLTPRATVRMAITPALPPAVRDRLWRYWTDGDERESTIIIEAMAFACYATVHDRPDVGALAVTEAQRATALWREVSAATNDPRRERLPAAAASAYRDWELTSWCLQYMVQVSLVWLPSLVTALWRRRRLATTSMRCGHWLWPLGATLMAASILRHWDPLSGVLFPDERLPWDENPLDGLYCAFAALIWPAALTAASWLAVRRAVAAAPDAPRPSVAATAALHAVPALAALLLFTVLALGVSYALLDASHAQQWRLEEQGTLHVLGITGY